MVRGRIYRTLELYDEADYRPAGRSGTKVTARLFVSSEKASLSATKSLASDDAKARSDQRL